MRADKRAQLIANAPIKNAQSLQQPLSQAEEARRDKNPPQPQVHNASNSDEGIDDLPTSELESGEEDLFNEFKFAPKF